MKVGIYSPYLDDAGGGEKYMLTIAECLSNDHEVSVFWDNPQDVKKIIERFSLKIEDLKIVKNIFSNNYPLMKRLSESKRYDAIVVLSDGSLPFLLTKTFIHIQQPLPNISLSSTAVFKKIFIKKIFCNSLYTKFFTDQKFNTNSIVIYPPVDNRSKNVEKENIILTVGRFRVRNLETGTAAPVDFKKQGLLANVFKDMVDKGLKNWKLIIATSVNESEASLFDKFRKIYKDYPVTFVVNKRNDELWEYYSKAKIYWHASGYGEDLDRHPEFAEHFGISTVEAMFSGVVPVVINAGGQKEIVQDGENGYLWNNEDELKQKTENLINNSIKLSQISKVAASNASKYSKERFCKEINEMLAQ